MIIETYSGKLVTSAISQLKKRKANGEDGITGEVYKARTTWIEKPLTQNPQKIQTGDQIAQVWKQGTVVDIYKNKRVDASVRITGRYA